MAQLGELASLLDEGQKQSVQVLAVSPDNHEQDLQLLDKLEKAKGVRLDYPLLSDPDHRVIDRYGILNPGRGIPHPATYVIDEEGIVRWMFLETDYTVRPGNEEILQALQALD